MKVWLYWQTPENKNKPDYIDLCHQTIFHHLDDCCDIVILNDKNISQYLTDIHQNYWEINVLAHKADYIRAKILYKYGGLWLDSDIIALNKEDFITLFNYLDKYDFVGFVKNRKNHPVIWAFLANKESKLVGEWIFEVEKLLDNKTMFNWTEIGDSILFKLLKNKNAEYYKYHEISARNTVSPIFWDESGLFFKNVPIKQYLREFQPFIVLYNKVMGDRLNNLSKKDIELSDTLMSNFFKNSGIFNI